jgi:hypothetical protein
MLADAPAVLAALEQSAFAAGIRQSVWAYPAANVGHILGLFLFAGAVCVMDLALLGAFGGTAPGKFVLQARRAAIGGLLLMAASGSILFAAEASHVAMNPVFQVKAGLIGLGVVNALMVAPSLRQALDGAGVKPWPLRLRLAAAFSLLIWLSVAACGRLIAYV